MLICVTDDNDVGRCHVENHFSVSWVECEDQSKNEGLNCLRLPKSHYSTYSGKVKAWKYVCYLKRTWILPFLTLYKKPEVYANHFTRKVVYLSVETPHEQQS